LLVHEPYLEQTRNHMTGHEEAPRVLITSVESVRTLFGAAACSVALVDDEGEHLRYVAADGAGADEIVGVSLPAGRGIAGWAAMSGQPIAVRDVASDARFARDIAESTKYVPEVILAAPLLSSAGEVVGVVSVLDPDIDESSGWTLSVLGTLASHMALLLDGSTGSGSDGQDPLALLGAEVVRSVEAWQSAARRKSHD
jgi:signal transduction protein with GAF and PtsI domain